MSSSRGSQSPNLHGQEYGMVVSASAMGAILVVSGFCWIFYCLCHPQNRIARSKAHNTWNVNYGSGRSPPITSVSSGGMVPGDEHGHYYTGRNPGIYLDSSPFTRVQTPSPNRLNLLSTFHSPFSGRQSSLMTNPTLNVAHSQFEMEDPPPYPGELEKVVSATHSPVKLPLPPPYSA